jgi:para-nitrobenzyl esterase
VFGADPDRITVYGESAGAKAVAALMGSPAAHGLFAQAISSSGGDSVAAPAATADVARRVLAHLEAPRSADDPMADLRALPAAAILAAQDAVCPSNQTVWVWRANLHPTVLPARPIDSIGAGSAAGVRALIGNNADEAVFFAQLWGAEHCLGPLPDVLGAVLAGQPLDRLIDLYSESRAIAGAPADRTRAGLALMGDERYAIPTLRLAEAQSQHGTVFRYRLDVAPPNYPPEYAGGHTCDLPMAWQTPELQQALPLDAEGRRVAAAFHEAMASFIRTGVPSAEALPQWPRFDTTARATMVFGTRCEVRNDPRAVEREVWPDQWEYGTWWILPDE